MSDSQLRQTISQLSAYAAPAQRYAPRRRQEQQPAPQPVPVPVPQPLPAYTLPPVPNNPPRAPLTSTPQALTSTYSSRLRTGSTLLMQPILSSSAPAQQAGTARTSTRRGGAINYADPGSGDELPDAGALDSDDSDFVAGGGLRTSVRQGRQGGSATPIPNANANASVDQSYLGMVPPSRFIKSRPMPPTQHVYPTQEMLLTHAQKRASLIPIRVEFETDTHRIRDCFVWNVNETLIRPETFARTFCADLDLPFQPWLDTVANQIRAQIEEHEGVAAMDLGIDGAVDPDADSAPAPTPTSTSTSTSHPPANPPATTDPTTTTTTTTTQTTDPPPEPDAECRVILEIDVQIAHHHLHDHIEWDLLSPLTPERFARTLCADLGLAGEAVPLVAHAVHEELLKHKRDVIEWGVVDAASGSGSASGHAGGGGGGGGGGALKDRTGLGMGLGWGRGPREGRGPRVLRSVWRDWAEAEEFRTTFEVMSAEEVERREVERERASRRLRRETSKFQTTRSSRRVRY
ncbi:hypothetical protein H0H92_003398 [Tricholoma furcatifolium]|nr:hypothetical protein H0H92_003398 [Tricholoma furcatifolium]